MGFNLLRNVQEGELTVIGDERGIGLVLPKFCI